MTHMRRDHLFLWPGLWWELPPGPSPFLFFLHGLGSTARPSGLWPAQPHNVLSYSLPVSLPLAVAILPEPFSTDSLTKIQV